VGEAHLVLQEVEKQMPAAKVQSLRKRAKGLRQEAQAALSEAEEIENQVMALNRQIEALEGCLYVPPVAMSRGRVGARSQELRYKAGKLTSQADYLETEADFQGKQDRRTVDQWQA
jgi:hypothetical protein